MTEQWRREDGTTYTRRTPVFVGKGDLINLIERVIKVIAPDEVSEIVTAHHFYQTLCLDSAFTNHSENYKVPCGRKLNSAEDRNGIKCCGAGFADERSSLAKPWLCAACEFKVRQHCELDQLTGSAHWIERRKDQIQEDLEFIYDNCVQEGDLHIRPSRLLELVRHVGSVERTVTFEEIDRHLSRSDNRSV